MNLLLALLLAADWLAGPVLPSASTRAATSPDRFATPPDHARLIFPITAANCLPDFATSADFATWSAPQPLIEKRGAAKWIDFWIPGDAHRDPGRAGTSLKQFPRGWDTPRLRPRPIRRIRRPGPARSLMAS